MNVLRKVTYRTLYQVLNRLSIWWNWKWINDGKLFFGTALVILGIGESKEGRAAERGAALFYPIETTSDERGIENLVNMNSEARVDTIKEIDDGLMCYMAGYNTCEDDSLAIYQVVSDMPTFPGGSIREYIKEHIQYPVEAVEMGVIGKVFVQFIIEKDGSLDSVVVARKVHPLLDAEAVRVVSNMPKWKAGSHNGKFLRVSYTVPVHFSREMLDSLRQDSVIDKNDIFCYVTEEMPVFPYKSLQTYIAERLKYPEEAKKQKIEGKVFVSFVIDTTGLVTNVKVMRGVHPLLDAEAIRVVEALPRWEPAKQRGKKVRISYTVPIQFSAGK